MKKKDPETFIATSREFDFASFDMNATKDQGPRHTLSMLAEKTGGTIVMPTHQKAGIYAGLSSLTTFGLSRPRHWAAASTLIADAPENSAIFATGEDIGFPIFQLISWSKKKIRLFIQIQNPNSKFFKAYSKMQNFDRTVAYFLTNTSYKREIAVKSLGVSEKRIHILREQTDTAFFRPVPVAPSEVPLLAAGGLEQRDYRTLAEATNDLNLSVEICAMSPNAGSQKSIFPEIIPKNMTIHQYNWVELRELYNRAEIVILPMKENKFQAGLTTLIEAMACARPIIMTAAPGLVEQFANENLIITVPPGEPLALREAIQRILSDKSTAQNMGIRAQQVVAERHNCETLVSDLSTLMYGST